MQVSRDGSNWLSARRGTRRKTSVARPMITYSVLSSEHYTVAPNRPLPAETTLYRSSQRLSRGLVSQLPVSSSSPTTANSSYCTSAQTWCPAHPLPIPGIRAYARVHSTLLVCACPAHRPRRLPCPSFAASSHLFARGTSADAGRRSSGICTPGEANHMLLCTS